jgi:hypothetical protein
MLEFELGFFISFGAYFNKMRSENFQEVGLDATTFIEERVAKPKKKYMKKKSN